MIVTKKNSTIPELKSLHSKDLNKEEVIAGGVPVHVPDSFEAEFVMVYGTLKVKQGNWEWCLKDRSTYLDTQAMVGWYYNGGLSANYSGSEEDTLVVDIFQVHEGNSKKVNYALDRLEGCTQVSRGGYQPYAVPVTLPEGTILADGTILEEDTVVVAKAYPQPLDTRNIENNDYIKNSVAKFSEDYKKHVEETHPKNWQNFINFYNL